MWKVPSFDVDVRFGVSESLMAGWFPELLGLLHLGSAAWCWSSPCPDLDTSIPGHMGFQTFSLQWPQGSKPPMTSGAAYRSYQQIWWTLKPEVHQQGVALATKMWSLNGLPSLPQRPLKSLLRRYLCRLWRSWRPWVTMRHIFCRWWTQWWRWWWNLMKQVEGRRKQRAAPMAMDADGSQLSRWHIGHSSASYLLTSWFARFLGRGIAQAYGDRLSGFPQPLLPDSHNCSGWYHVELQVRLPHWAESWTLE